MRLDGLLVTGAMIAVLAWSARSVYEDLDQDVPYIRWPMVVLQIIGYGIVAYSLVRTSSGTTLEWVMPAISVLLLSIGAVIDAVDVDVNIWSEIVQALGYAVIAYSASSGSGLTEKMIAAFSGLVLVLTKSMLLPAEKERRIALGPGMALLVIGWGMMAYALAKRPYQSTGTPVSNNNVQPIGVNIQSGVIPVTTLPELGNVNVSTPPRNQFTF